MPTKHQTIETCYTFLRAFVKIKRKNRSAVTKMSTNMTRISDPKL